jgi:hypothetical protein
MTRAVDEAALCATHRADKAIQLPNVRKSAAEARDRAV